MKAALAWVAAVVLTFGGVVVAVLHRPSDDGPAQVVRDYFAALARSDAPTALALGAVPSGGRDFLTSDVLRVQNRIAALHDVTVRAAEVSGSRATVRFSYLLAFADADEPVDGSVEVDHDASGWRLQSAAVPVQLSVSAAQNLATLAGAAVPSGLTSLFPGAVPILFAGTYLTVVPDTAFVGFGDEVEHGVDVRVSKAGETALRAELAHRLDACFGVEAPADCPLPSSPRVVPGTLAGILTGDAPAHVRFSVDGVGDGRIAVSGSASFRGTYARISFDNLPSRRNGSLELDLSGTAAPRPPALIRFGGAS